MLIGFSFCARKGKEAELEALLADPDGGRRVAAAIGASRNVLFWQADRMVRVLEFADDAVPVPMAQAAAEDPEIAALLTKIGRLSDPPFDPLEPGSLEAFSEASGLRLVYDVHA